MNVRELPLMFPAVLDGSCPLGIFADAVEECGFDLLAMWFRRSNQKKRSRKVAVAQMRHVLANPEQYQRSVTFHRQQAICDMVLPLVYAAAKRNGTGRSKKK